MLPYYTRLFDLQRRFGEANDLNQAEAAKVLGDFVEVGELME